MSSSSLGKESNNNSDNNAQDDQQQQEYGTTVDILHPGPHDVLLGRGGGTNNHIGNKNFRDLVTRHKMRYLACNKVDKPKVAREVVNIWKKLEPPGRFLQRKDETKKGPGSVRDEDVIWTEVDDQEARKKASQCLRERTPDVQPYLTQLRQQDDQQVSDDNVPAISLSDHAILPRGGGTTRATSVGSFMTDRTSADHMFRMSNQNSILRRGSMPATVHSSTVGLVPGLPAPAQAAMRLQDRRISLPPTSQYVTQQGQQHQPLDLITSWQHQAQSDSYTAVEERTTGTTNEINNVNLLQRQLQQRESMIQHQQLMAMRSAATMMQASRGNPTMLDMARPVAGGMGIGLSPQQIQRNALMAQAVSGDAQRLMQRQQFLLQQHQQLLAEQERLVRREHMITNREVALAQQQQVVNQMQEQSGFYGGPHAVTSTNLAGGKLGVQDWEPVPLSEEDEYTIPLAGEPDPQPSSTVVVEPKRNTTSKNDKKAETAKSNDTIKRKKEEEKGAKPSTGRKADGDEMSEQTLDPAPAAFNEANDSQNTLTEYRKLLESYISNHQNSIPSLESNGDLDQDREEEEDQTIDGVTPSDWIEQQLLNDDSGDLSMSTRDRPKPPRRSSSKKSLMSMASSAEHMSFAFSEMDHFEDLSKEENKRSTTRSMSILSTNTNMSELTDFDDLDCM